ncbi:hypothetical protein IKD56_00870 [bacterium]|nr:hypothetical protein [bacterium]
MIVVNTNTNSFHIEGKGTDVFNETVLILDKIVEKIFPDNVKEDFCKSLIMFLNTKIKTAPTLTEDEKVILMNIKPQPIIIGRDKNSILYLGNCNSVYKDRTISEYFNDLFQFIKPRRRI